MTQTKKKILVVEDEAALRKALVTKLTSEGFDVVEGQNGEEAVELTQSENPDAILMDIIMPRMHGVEACEKIRGKAWGKTVPIILLSNLSSDPSAQRLADTDDNCQYLVKSNTKIEDVIDTLNHYLA